MKSILLVDDNLNDIELVQTALKRSRLTQNIAVARDGGEALDYLYRRGSFSERTAVDPLFVLLDLKMPRMDGLEVLRQIKADERLRLIPIVMLTSSSEHSDLLKSYRLGVNAYVVKPVDFREFTDAIGQLGTFWSRTNQPPPLYLVS